jgi:hypothetical protein
MKQRIWLFILCILIISALTYSEAIADPILPLPRLPICGDQDGTELPFILQCSDFVNNPDVQAYQVNSDTSQEIKFDFVFREALYNNELGYFLVDDPTFSINGLHPGDSGYLTAVFTRMKIIFPSGSDAYTPDISFSFESGDILVFFIIQGNTLANLLVSNPGNDPNMLPLAFFSIDALNPDGVDHFIGYQNNHNGFTQFGFEDLTSGGDLDYDDVVYDMNFLGPPITAPPPYTTSYYIVARDRVGINSLGCDQGKKDLNLPGAQDSIVILDFFGPKERLLAGVKEYGLTLYRYDFVPMSEVADYVEQFAKGYYDCLGADKDSHLRIIIGTNNSTGSWVNYEAGRAFAKLVNDVSSWIINNGYSSQVDAAGGNDMEVNYNTPSATKAWIDGYASISTRYLYNYGDAGGCPQYGTTSSPGSCNNGWTQEDIWYISWKSPVAWPLPEIYNTVGSQSRHWQQISIYSYFKPDFPRMLIAGSLTQYQSCQQGRSCEGLDNKPETGWRMLLEALTGDTRTSQNLQWSTDIMWWIKP